MKNLLTIHETDINPGAPQINESKLILREAARGVVVGHDGEVYLLNVYTQNYHKLPGGGIDPGEDKVEAFKRECLEEIGCKVEVVAELGEITEYRHQFNQKQVSYCYLAKQVGDQGESSLEEGELAEGHDEVKAKNLDDAIRILEQDKPANYEGKFISKRDHTILTAARQIYK